MERVFEVLGMEADKPDRPDAREAPGVVQEVRFEDVEFEYREGRPVVREFNVIVRRVDAWSRWWGEAARARQR